MKHLRFCLQLIVALLLYAAPHQAVAEGVSSRACVPGNIEFASIFQSDMVLHDDWPRIWGKAQPGSALTVGLKNRPGTTISVQVDARGEWLAQIPVSGIRPGSTDIFARSDCEQKVVRDIFLGEVMLCSGQSNMHFPFRLSTSADEAPSKSEIARADDYLRLFQVDQHSSPRPLKDFAGGVHWIRPNSSNVGSFSAVCYNMGLSLAKRLKKPIGLIQSTVGGTAIQAWIPRGGFPSDYEPSLSQNPLNDSGVLYNAMIAPLGPMKISAVAWYQGEANRPQYKIYADLLRYFFRAWRQQFQDSKLDFHIVQLAGYGPRESAQPGDVVAEDRSAFSQLRHAQARAAATDKHVSLTSALGTTSEEEANASPPQIHPRAKKPVGLRLADAVLHLTFGYADRRPRFDFSAMRPPGTGTRIPFSVPKGQTLPPIGTRIKGFQVGRENGRLYYATDAVIVTHLSENQALIDIRSKEVPRPYQVRYQFAANPVVGYYASNDEPLEPLCVEFRSEAWRMCSL